MCSYSDAISVDDFKPASIDTTQEAIVKLGDNNQATVTLPHIQVSVFYGYVVFLYLFLTDICFYACMPTIAILCVYIYVFACSNRHSWHKYR